MVKEMDEGKKYGSVTGEVLEATAKSQNIRRALMRLMHAMINKLQTNVKIAETQRKNKEQSPSDSYSASEITESSKKRKADAGPSNVSKYLTVMSDSSESELNHRESSTEFTALRKNVNENVCEIVTKEACTTTKVSVCLDEAESKVCRKIRAVGLNKKANIPYTIKKETISDLEKQNDMPAFEQRNDASDLKHLEQHDTNEEKGWYVKEKAWTEDIQEKVGMSDIEQEDIPDLEQRNDTELESSKQHGIHEDKGHYVEGKASIEVNANSNASPLPKKELKVFKKRKSLAVAEQETCYKKEKRNTPDLEPKEDLLFKPCNNDDELVRKDCSGIRIQCKFNPRLLVENLEDKDIDGFSQIWREMNLAIECLKDEPINLDDSTQEKDCNHFFIYEDDLGNVCKLCGLVGERAESIFDFDWSKGRKQKRSSSSNDEDAENLPREGIDLKDEDNETSPLLQQISIHPMLEDRMHKHQRDGFKFLTRNLVIEKPGGCIVAHAPGTGKTFLITSFIQSFLQKYPKERILIVAPKAVLGSWKRELTDWQLEEIPILDLYDVYNKMETTRYSQLEILKQWKNTKSILLASYAQFSSIVIEKPEEDMIAGYHTRQILLNCPGLLVLDEGHFPRNGKSNILHALMQVKTRRRILLSGTLFQNNITELFNLLRLARPAITEDEAFKVVLKKISINENSAEVRKKKLYADKEERIFCGELESCLQSESQEIRAKAIYDIQKLVSPFVHYYKGEILETLPGLSDFVVIVNLNAKQKAAVKSIKMSTLPRMSKLIKEAAVSIHPALKVINVEKEDNLSEWMEQDIGSDIDIVADPETGVKTKFIFDLLMLCEINEEKVLVFSQFLSPLKLLENMLMSKKKWRKGTEMLRLDGHTISEDREDIIYRFNNSREAKILFASIKACGEGINLTGASRVVLLDIQWNPSITRQAISRAFRIGQKKKVFAYRLVAAETLEEEMFRAAFGKEILSKSIFDGQSHEGNQNSLMTEIALSECDDLFFESKPLKKNVQTLYRLKVM